MRWIVDEVKPFAAGHASQSGCGFNILDNEGAIPRRLLSLSYKTKEEADEARKLVEQAISAAIDINSH